MPSTTKDLLQQYDVPTPRYTSYPTVPYWDFSTLDEANWKKSVVDTFEKENGELCVYIHLPFCENMCTFCACNKRITVNHAVEDPYIKAVLAEWNMYRSLLVKKPVIREIHLGGGTPTFFSPDHLAQLIQGITEGGIIPTDHAFSVEVHPNYTTEEHIKRLAEVGFNRISLGVQDFDPQVQQVINRVQSYEKTKEVVDWARKCGYTSINIDLIYGLPHQTVSSIEHTIALVNKCMPDRIAFYSYAHVPWKSKVQRRYSEDDLPVAADKWAMYSRGRELLEMAGFQSIGMDHFALPGDKLFTAAASGNLHRNFMGYTTTQSKLIIGLGVSSISDAWTAFAQNEKEVEAYELLIGNGKFPIVHGHGLNREDQVIRKNILELMCCNHTRLDAAVLPPAFLADTQISLAMLSADGLVICEGWEIQVTGKGRSFIRNISAAIDARLWRKKSSAQTFSKAI